jgi:mercuric ion transport protein
MEKQKEPVRGREGIAWGLGAALIASLCCVGPVVAVVLGLGSASFLFGLTAYRPYFLGFSLLLIGVGIFLLLRRSQKCCSREQHRRNLWVYPSVALAAFLLSYGLLTYALPDLAYRGLERSAAPSQAPSTGQASAAPSRGEPSQEALRQATLDIKGMT